MKIDRRGSCFRVGPHVVSPRWHHRPLGAAPLDCARAASVRGVLRCKLPQFPIPAFPLSISGVPRQTTVGLADRICMGNSAVSPPKGTGTFRPGRPPKVPVPSIQLRSSLPPARCRACTWVQGVASAAVAGGAGSGPFGWRAGGGGPDPFGWAFLSSRREDGG